MKIRNALIVWLFLAALAIVPASSQVTTSISAPYIVDESLLPGFVIPINIAVTDVEDLFGFQFVLHWDPDILSYYDYAKRAPFIEPDENVVDQEAGFAAYAGYMPLGTPKGEGFYGSGVIATIYLEVIDVGGTILDLTDVGMIDTYGNPMLQYYVIDGFVSSVEVANSVELRRCIAEHEIWAEAKDPENTLHAKAKNKGTVTTNAYVEFIIEDESGVMYAEVLTDTVMLKSNEMHDFTITIDKFWLIAQGAPLPGYGAYYVHVKIHYYVGGGMWDTGRQTMKFHFTLYPDVPGQV